MMLGLTRLVKDARSFGLTAALGAYCLRVARCACSIRVLECVVIEPPLSPQTTPQTCRFLTRDELQRFAGQPGYELDPHFLAGALAKGDACHAIFDGDTLAAYGWSAVRPTELAPGFQVTTGTRCVYMYKGFTKAEYRGRRLHAAGRRWAAGEFRTLGYRAVVSYVDAGNLASLRSCRRMGYRRFGWTVLAGWPGMPWSWTSAGCRDYGFEVTASPAREFAPAGESSQAAT